MLSRIKEELVRMADEVLSSAQVAIIKQVLKRGYSVELKMENGKLVVVEIRRQVKIKTSITG